MKTVVHEVIFDTTTAALDRSALEAQGRQITGRRGGGRANMEGTGGYTGGILVAVVAPQADKEVLEEYEEMALWFIATIGV